MRAGRAFRGELERIEAETKAAMAPSGPVTLALDGEAIEALAMGARLLEQQGDPALSAGAALALERLSEVVPEVNHPRSGFGMGQEASQARDEAMTAIAGALPHQHQASPALRRRQWPQHRPHHLSSRGHHPRTRPSARRLVRDAWRMAAFSAGPDGSASPDRGPPAPLRPASAVGMAGSA